MTARGRLLYLGDAHKVQDWFTSLGYAYDGHSNPADWMIDLCSTDFEKDTAVFGKSTMRTTEDIIQAAAAFRKSDIYLKMNGRGRMTALERHLSKDKSAAVAQVRALLGGTFVDLAIFSPQGMKTPFCHRHPPFRFSSPATDYRRPKCKEG